MTSDPSVPPAQVTEVPPPFKGTSDGITNGNTDGITNGTSGDITNGITNGTTNGTTNGATTKRPVVCVL